MNTQSLRKVALSSALLALAASPALAILPFAKGELFVQGELRTEYDSNIYVNSAEVNDTLFTFTPGVSFIRNAGLLRLSVSTGLEIQRFVDNTQHDGENGQFSTSLNWNNEEGKADAKLNLGANRTAFANTYLNDRTVTDNYSLTGNFGLWTTEKFGFRLSTDLLDQRSVKGGYSDVRKSLFGVDGRYLVSPKLEVVGGYAYRHTGTYKASTTAAELRSDDHRFSVGVDGEITSKVKGQILAGYVLRDLSQGSSRNQSSPFAKIALDWETAEKTRFNFSIKKDFDTSAANQSINKFDVTLSGTQDLNAKLSATTTLNYMHGNYVGGSAGRADNSYMGRVSFNYRFTDRASAMVYGSMTRSTSSMALAEYKRYTIGFSVIAKF